MRLALFRQPEQGSAIRLQVDRGGTPKERLARIKAVHSPRRFWKGIPYADSIPLYTKPTEGVFCPLPLVEAQNGLVLLEGLRDHPRFRPADLTELFAYLQVTRGALRPQQEILAFGSIVPDQEGILRVPCATTKGSTKKPHLAFRKVADIFGFSSETSVLVWQKT